MSAIDAAVQPDRRPRVGESQSAAGAAGIDLRHFVDAVLGRPNSNTHFPLDDVESLIQQYVAQESSRSQEVARLKSVVTKLKTQAQKILARYRALQQEHKQCTAQPEAPEEKCLARKGTISAPVESPSRVRRCSAALRVCVQCAPMRAFQTECMPLDLTHAFCAQGVSADVRVGAPLSDEATSEMLSQFESLKAENKSLLSTIEALRAERVVLDCALKDANAQSAADTGKARKMQQQLQREVRRLQVKLGKLQEKEAGATRAEQVLADIRAKEAAEALADAKKAAAKAMMIAESTSSQLQELKEVREQLQSETAFLHRRVDQETEARRRVINQLRQSQKEAVEQRACVDELRDRATSANSEFAELGSKLQTCKKELQVALTERESEARLFQSERETLEAELRELRESHAAQWSAMAGSTASSPQTGNLGALDGDTPVPTKLADNFEMSQSRDELTALRRAYRVLQQQLDDFQTEAHVNQIAMARVLHEEHEQVQASAALRIAESEARHAELLDELREAQVETETQTAALKVELEDRDRVYFDLKLRLQSNVQVNTPKAFSIERAFATHSSVHLNSASFCWCVSCRNPMFSARSYLRHDGRRHNLNQL